MRVRKGTGSTSPHPEGQPTAVMKQPLGLYLFFLAIPGILWMLTVAERAIKHAFDRGWGRAGETETESTCQWLYRNLTMDAGGRIMPCCSAPRKDGDLLFSHFEDGSVEDPFNSAKHQAARTHLPNPASDAGKGLFCAQCEFDWRADPSPHQIRDYFAAATRDRLGARHLDVLASW